jgi:hypothetical protein
VIFPLRRQRPKRTQTYPQESSMADAKTVSKTRIGELVEFVDMVVNGKDNCPGVLLG